MIEVFIDLKDDKGTHTFQVKKGDFIINGNCIILKKRDINKNKNNVTVDTFIYSLFNVLDVRTREIVPLERSYYENQN